MRNIRDFDKILIKLASPEKIMEWSYGEVKKPETINYRTLRPEKDGLFCERIFGTTKEWECFCGKFKSIRYKGVVCDRCGVEVTHFKVRRERGGHIDLASPVSHIWYYKSVPSRIGLLLGMTMNDLRSVLYFERYIITDPGETPRERLALITEEEYIELKETYGSNFEAGIGADVIKQLLSEIDLKALADELRIVMHEKGGKTDPKILKRLSICVDFHKSDNKPEWMIMEKIPVIPPELRPMVQLDGGRFATSDLNDLYRRVINRNNRLKRLQDLFAPEIIIRNEKRMLQEAVDALFDNSKRKRVVKGPGNRPLKSLADMLKGKQGRFRQNLLGKRVDYSGRSVIIVGPTLKLHQCGLPKKMALELFKPFIMKKLYDKGYVYNIKSAKKMVEREAEEVWSVIEEIVKEHPILLNRAPTLHRLGIQAFEPVLVDSKAIKLHPLVCHAFNADFDGDQMAVHVPLSPEAQIECWFLMLSSKNLLNPANGQPIVGPTQDMVLGIYYLTKEDLRLQREKIPVYSSEKEVMMALEFKTVEFQEKIKVKLNNEYVETTPGRVIFNSILPEGHEYMNKVMKKRDLSDLISDIFNRFGPSSVSCVLDDIKDMGFKYATKFGATIGIDDIKIPDEKKGILDEAEKKVENIHEMYSNGHLTNVERYNMIINEWTQVNNKISDVMFKLLQEDDGGFNPIYIMADSGARGSQQQIKQLAGMRGLMAKPSGDIIEYPILSNFKEGLNVLEYFISTHGARKGLADTALKTADAGYLTRRLVDIAQDVVVKQRDCGTINGIEIEAVREGDDVIEKLSDRILGSVCLDDVLHPKTGEVIVASNEEIDEQKSAEIEKCGIDSVRIRSVLTCESKQGICGKCYGRNLATNNVVEIGEAVGIIAAQSIGQPGTQLTMRTFHIGGIAAGSIKEDSVKLGYDAIIRKLPDTLIKVSGSSKKSSLIIPRKGEMIVQRVFETYNTTKWKAVKVKDGERLMVGDLIGKDEKDNEIKSEHHATVSFGDKKLIILGSEHSVQLKPGSTIFAKKDDFIKSGKIIVSFDPYSEPIIAENNGKVVFERIEIGVNVKETQDEKTGKKLLVAYEVKEEEDQPRISVGEGAKAVSYHIPGGAILVVDEGAAITAGEIIAKMPRELTKTKDITGGLPRVAELFEARRPKDGCIVTAQDGSVKFEGTSKGKRVISVINENKEESSYNIPFGKHILVRENDYVKAGDQLCDGPVDPHDILEIKGEHELMRYLLNEIQEVYRLQGVKINDKHIGIIVRQMLRKVEITDVGDTDLIIGDQINKFVFKEKNEDTLTKGGKPAMGRPILLGLTKASISIESFISAASFQETTKVLTNAAIKGKIDNLRGLKENVIIGHKVPAGTGLDVYEKIELNWPEENNRDAGSEISDDEEEDYGILDEEYVTDENALADEGFTVTSEAGSASPAEEG